MSTRFHESLRHVAMGAAGLMAVLATAAPAPESAAAAPAGKAVCDVTVKSGQSVAKAVERAKKGDTVCVRFGVYDERSNVFVGPAKANLTIVGFANRRLPVPPAIFTRSGCTIAVRARNVRVSNLALVGKAGRNTDGLCFLEGSSGSRATDVVTRKHAGVGFLVSHTKNVRLERVQAVENRGPGIHGVVSTHVTIRHAFVRRNGFGGGPFWEKSGIRFFAVRNSSITQSTVRESRGAGIYLNGISNSNLIARNQILENGDDGINFESNVAAKYGDDNPAVPAQNRVRSNQLLRNRHEGIHVYSGSNNLFEENWIRDSWHPGVVMDCQVGSGNVVRSNTIERSGRVGTNLELLGHGVFLANPDPVRVESNEIRDNPWHGVHVERVTCPVGAAPSYSTGATAHQIQENLIKDNTKSGVHMMGVSDVRVLHNVIASNREYGVLVNRGQATGAAKNGIIRENEIRDSGKSGVRLAQKADSTRVEQNTILRSGEHGIEVVDSAEVDVRKNTVRESKRDGLFAIKVLNLKVQENSLLEGREDGITLIDPDKANVSKNLVRESKNDGLVALGAKSLTVGLNKLISNGHDGVRIQTGSNEAWVDQNEVLQNKNEGISIEGGSSHILSGNKVDENGGHGIRLNSVTGTSVQNNDVKGNAGSGIRVENSKKVQVLKTTSVENKRHGLEAIDADELEVRESSFSSNKGDESDGAMIVDSEKVQVSKSSFTGNRCSGLVAIKADQLTLEKSNLSSNKRDGVRIVQSTTVAIRDNDVRSNGWDGIRFQSTNGSTVERNRVIGNHGLIGQGRGIRLQSGSSANTFSRNRVEGNRFGIDVEAGAASNTILTNSFVGNDHDGASANPRGTNTWFVHVGDCSHGNYWTPLIAVRPHPACPETRDSDYFIGDEEDRGPLLTPPV